MRHLFLSLLLVLTAGCRWARTDKIGGPAWDTRSVDDRWTVSGRILAPPFEVQVKQVLRQRQRAAVVGTIECTTSLEFSARNLGAAPASIDDLTLGTVGARGKLRLHLGYLSGPATLQPGQQGQYRFYGVANVAALCDELASLRVGGVDVALQPLVGT